jgi:ketosteroid isomerase-like protein
MMNVLRALALGWMLAAMAFVDAGHAQTTMKPEEVAKAKADVLTTVNAYFAAFNQHDTQKIANELFTNPSMTMGAAGVSANSPDQVAKQYAGNLQRLVEAGWEKSVILHYDVCLMNPTLAFAHGTFNRLRKDGSILQSGASTYMLNKGKDGWRIVMLIAHDKDKVMSCND